MHNNMDLFKYLMDLLKRMFCVTVICVTVCGGSEHCPSSVQESGHFIATFNKTCYMFVNKEKFWNEARDFCWQAGGEMLYVKNAATMQFIKKVLNSPKLGWSKNGVWNGASDLRDRGWEWTTGETLQYNYWDDGQPGSFLGFVSLENCCCMRRSDGWRWHDYHCHVDGYEYNFICQFPFVATHTVVSPNKGAPLNQVSDDTVAIICLAVGGILLLVVLGAVSYLLYRKHEHQKASVGTTAVRFRTTGYATIMRDVGRDTDSNRDVGRADRPISNVYLEPREVTRIYEEVLKDTDHGVNSLSGQGERESAPLVYRGGAATMDDVESGAMSNSPSEASGATSGYCSGTLERRANESDYIEMSGDSSMGNISSQSAVNGACGVSEGSPSKCAGATGKGACPSGTKNTNLYVTPSCVNGGSSAQGNKDGKCDVDKKPCNLEMHIYTNQTEQAEFDKLNQRPLPPVPCI